MTTPCREMRGKPILRVKRNPKTTHIGWEETMMGSEEVNLLGKHYQKHGLDHIVHGLFKGNEAIISHKSRLGYGGAYGGWDYCPNKIADVLVPCLEWMQRMFVEEHGCAARRSWPKNG